MILVKNGKSFADVCIVENSSPTICRAAQAFIETVKVISGVALALRKLPFLTGEETGVVLATFSQLSTAVVFEKWQRECKDDGFCVVKNGKSVYVLSHAERGVLYGAHDLLEKNAEALWARGEKTEQLAYLNAKTVALQKVDYTENSPFKVRAWNLCGVGADGEAHADEGTFLYTGANKSNGVGHRFEEEWEKYGIFGSGIVLEEIANIDHLAKSHPDWFMTAPDGGIMPALNGWDSYLNYYNADYANVIVWYAMP